MLRVEGLGKRYSDRWIFRNLAFELQKGQVLTVLGPNGCGKSTLLSVIAGLIPATEGTVKLPDGDPRRTVGYAALAAELYASLTVAEHLELTADLRGCPARIEELLDLIGLRYAADYLARTLSSGMRARLKLAIALQPNPTLLLLDEPGAGLDAEGVEALGRVIEHQRTVGAVLLATNDAQERAHATHELQIA